MKREFIIDSIIMIDESDNQKMSDSQFDELIDKHNLSEDEGINELFDSGLFVRTTGGFYLNRIND